MQLTVDCGVFFVCLFVLILASRAASERMRGQFREVVVNLDNFSNPTDSQATGSGFEGSGSTGRSKPWRPNKTLGEGIAGEAGSTRREPRQDSSEPTAYRHDSTHCMNGGTGFLRSFCFCNSKYTGRYCEHQVNSSCDTVRHGDWMYTNCNYCQCVDGVFECKRHELKGCSEELESPKQQNYDSSIALEMHLHSNGCIPWRSSSLVPLVAMVVLVHIILWLQNISFR